MTGFLTDFVSTVSEAALKVIGLMAEIINNVLPIFYTPGAEGAAGSFTILGIVVILVIAAPIAVWGVNLILRLFRTVFRALSSSRA